LQAYDVLFIVYQSHVLECSDRTRHYYTRKLSYRKDDRAMRPIYGCPENFQESRVRTRLLFPKF